MESLYKDKIVFIKDNCSLREFGGEMYIKDYWTNIYGKSWRDSRDNMICVRYAIRIGVMGHNTPLDDNVLYGKINGGEFLIHETEIDSIKE